MKFDDELKKLLNMVKADSPIQLKSICVSILTELPITERVDWVGKLLHNFQSPAGRFSHRQLEHLIGQVGENETCWPFVLK